MKQTPGDFHKLVVRGFIVSKGAVRINSCRSRHVPLEIEDFFFETGDRRLLKDDDFVKLLEKIILVNVLDLEVSDAVR